MQNGMHSGILCYIARTIYTPTCSCMKQQQHKEGCRLANCVCNVPKIHQTASAHCVVDPAAARLVFAPTTAIRSLCYCHSQKVACWSLSAAACHHRYGLQRISPLLSNVAAIQEGGTVDISLTPENLALPAEKTTVRIEPMKLVVGRGDFLSKIVNLVGLKDRCCTADP